MRCRLSVLPEPKLSLRHLLAQLNLANNSPKSCMLSLLDIVYPQRLRQSHNNSGLVMYMDAIGGYQENYHTRSPKTLVLNFGPDDLRYWTGNPFQKIYDTSVVQIDKAGHYHVKGMTCLVDCSQIYPLTYNLNIKVQRS